MLKRKRAPVIPPSAVVANANVSTNASVLEEQPDECFDILDGALAEAASPDSLELSSPLVSNQEKDEFTLEPELAIPVSKKQGIRGKKALVVKPKGEENDGKIADRRVETNWNGMEKKATTVKEKPRAKKKKVNENDEGGFEEPEERSPPVNSSCVPIPWKGRLGFVSLSIVFPTPYIILTV